MSERYYKIGNQWIRWSYAHNQLGYSKNPTIAIDYISTDQATWGQPISGAHGYFDGDEFEPQDGLYFANDQGVSPQFRGWKIADVLANIGRMPEECVIDDELLFTNGTITSKCARLSVGDYEINPDYYRYLIASVVNLGWHTLSEWEELGWTTTVPESLLFGGDFSGNRITLKSVDGGGDLIAKYAHSKAIFDLVGWSSGGMIEHGAPTMEINLGQRWDTSASASGWLAKTFPYTSSSNNSWYGGILSQEDLDALKAFGGNYCPTTGTAYAGLIGELRYEPYKFSYELLEMYSGVGVDPVTFDKGLFQFLPMYDTQSGSRFQYYHGMWINSKNSTGTATTTYRVRITDNDPGAIYVLCGFSYSSGSWNSKTFTGSTTYGYAALLMPSEKNRLDALGLWTAVSGYSNGAILYSSDYNYECVQMYNDSGPVSLFDPSSFYVEKHPNAATVIVFRNSEFGISVLYWLCRITRKTSNPPTLEINFGLRWDTTNGGWMSKTFPANDWWWAGILSQADANTLSAFGVTLIPASSTSSQQWVGPYGTIRHESYKFSYQLIAMYSDVGETSVAFNALNFYPNEYFSSSSQNYTLYRNSMALNAINAFSTPTMTYRMRIIDRDPGATYVMCGMKYDTSNNEWVYVTFENDAYWWAGAYSEEDKAKLQALGLWTTTNYPYGEILYSDDYNFECVRFDTSTGPKTSASLYPSNFYVAKHATYDVCCIYRKSQSTTNVKYWVCRITPRDYNAATGSIANIALPTGHDGHYTDVTFESLRYYANGTISNTGQSGQYYYGTLTWTDSSLGDLSDKINVTAQGSSIAIQETFRIIFMTDGSISGYRPSERSSENNDYISSYSYNNGTHSITFYCKSVEWYNQPYSGGIHLRYLDGTTTFKNLSALDLIDISSGVLSKDTTTDRYDMYNAWGGDISIKAKFSS